MRIAIVAAFALALTTLVGTRGHADPYRWCAEYGGGGRAAVPTVISSPWSSAEPPCQASVASAGRTGSTMVGPVTTPETMGSRRPR